MNRAARVLLSGVAVTAFVHGSTLHAQDRLLTRAVFASSMTGETIRFGGDGLVQLGFAGLDSARVTSVSQVSLPFSTGVTLGRGWRVDVTALMAAGRVTYRDMTPGGKTQTAILTGVSDLRIRGTGSVLHESLFLTVGANIPTGRTSLSIEEFSTLRILAAPALGMSSSPVGSGVSGTLGLVYARTVQEWSVAAGASYEHRGEFQPVAALQAGAPSADFIPGGVVRTSLSADRLVGEHRLTLAFTADVFAEDRLRGAVTSGTTREVTELARVQLGPVYSLDAQVALALPRVRNTVAYSSYRWRAPYLRDGVRVAESNAHYLEGGVRTSVPVTLTTDLSMGIDGRLHTGLGVDLGLPSAGVASAGGMLMLDMRHGQFNIQPYVRMQAGALSQRNSASSSTPSFYGASTGIVVVTRF